MPNPILDAYIAPGDDTVPDKTGVANRLTNSQERNYAHQATSRILPAWVNSILDDAAKGKTFDAWVFQCALTHVLSIAATRDGQSMGRRVWTRQARTLAHANQAVLQEALANLRDPDERVAAMQIAYDDLNARYSESVRALDNERLAHQDQAGHLRTALAKAEEVSGQWYASWTKTSRMLGYARRLLSATDSARVDGYADGLVDGKDLP